MQHSSEAYPCGRVRLREGYAGPSRVFVLVGSGCGGSIWVQRTLRTLLRLVFLERPGVNDVVFVPDESMGNVHEWLKGTPKKNVWCAQDEACAGEISHGRKGREYARILRKALKHREEKEAPGRVALFVTKLPAMELKNAVIVEELRRAGARFAATWRDNTIDKHVCMVRDCMGPEAWGHSVDETGSRTDLCFSRRSSSTKVKAVLSTDGLVAALRDKSEEPVQLRARLESSGVRGLGVVPLSALSAYMYSGSDRDFRTSVEAWRELLEELGVSTRPEVIRRVLEPDRGKKTPSPHSESIQNAGEVRDTLRSSPDLLRLFR